MNHERNFIIAIESGGYRPRRGAELNGLQLLKQWFKQGCLDIQQIQSLPLKPTVRN